MDDVVGGVDRTRAYTRGKVGVDIVGKSKTIDIDRQTWVDGDASVRAPRMLSLVDRSSSHRVDFLRF